MGQQAILDEDTAIIESDIERNKFGFRMAEAEKALMQAHADGHYRATYIAYPIIYGPRQPAPLEWCVIRRVLDGRRQFVIADGGIKLESRAYAENAAHAVLLAVDKPDVSAGRKYVVADAKVYSMRQRIEAIARQMCHSFEFIDMPYELALPCHVMWRNMRGHRLRDTRRIREELSFKDVVTAEDATRQTVEWLLTNQPGRGGELELKLGDPFDYKREDNLIAEWTRWRACLPPLEYPMSTRAHMYRHPSGPNEPWRPFKHHHE
jgi:nucleoside-diphosphate-sugar epimerase